MIDTATRYPGELHFSYLAGAADKLQVAAKAFAAHPAILRLADEWILMTNRCWNEHGYYSDPVTENELQHCVREQLGVMHPALPSKGNDNATV